MKKTIVVLLAIALSLLSLTQMLHADAALDAKKKEAIQWVEEHFGPNSKCPHDESYQGAIEEINASQTMEEIQEILKNLEEFYSVCLEAIQSGDCHIPHNLPDRRRVFSLPNRDGGN